jgi:NADPH:quinone reductase-like Zn-dependent oxidoreductase
MRAAQLHEVGVSLKVEDIAEPTLRLGGVIVRSLATFVLGLPHR